MSTLGWMVETLRQQRDATEVTDPGQLHELAMPIVSRRAVELSDEETAMLMQAGREVMLTAYQVEPEHRAVLLDGGVMGAANRALLREQGDEPDPDADADDIADDESALLDVLTMGVVLLAQGGDEW